MGGISKKNRVYQLMSLPAILMYHKIGCCCIPTPLTLVSGGSPMIPLVIHQPVYPSIWPAVPSRQQGLPTMMDIPLNTFMDATEAEMWNIIKLSPVKSCELDPLSTWLLKECKAELVPLITDIVNMSLRESMIPKSLKTALI